MSKKWTNWSGKVNCTPDSILRPETETEIEELISETSDQERTLRVAGSGHSFSPLVPSEDLLVSLGNYDGIVEVDESSKTATVRAGTTLSELGPQLFSRGLAMENLGDIDQQAIAGAISTGTHGTGIRFGILSTQLQKIKLISPAKGIIECSPDVNEKIFRSAQVSLGSLGILSCLTLNLESAYHLREKTRIESLKSCLANLKEYRENNRHFEFFWFPHTDKVMVKTLNRTKDHNEIPDWTYSELAENYLLEGLCRLGSKIPRLSPILSRITSLGATGTDVTGPSYKIFSTIRDVRFNEMEYGVPASRGSEVFRHLKDWINSVHRDVQFPVEFRYVNGDEIPLSPAYGGERAFIAVHKYHRKPYEKYLKGAENIFRQYNGRPHWGKIHYRDKDELSDLYPKWDEFQSVRKELDPQGIFLNDYLENILDS